MIGALDGSDIGSLHMGPFDLGYLCLRNLRPFRSPVHANKPMLYAPEHGFPEFETMPCIPPFSGMSF